MAAKRSSTCRQRKCSCEECGYTVRVTRSWMAEGLPICPRHGSMLPSSPADLAFCGIIGPDDMPAAMWTSICRENGWDGAIARKGAAAKAHAAKTAGSALFADRSPADHCAFAGCGRWVAAGADRCSAGHAQHDDARELEVCAF